MIKVGIIVTHSIFTTMKTLSIITYFIGSILLIISCFTSGITATWLLGGLAVLFLILGCVFQFNSTKTREYSHHIN